MPQEPSIQLVLVGAAMVGVLGGLLFIAGIGALFRARPLRFVFRTVAGTFLVGIAALAATVVLGIQGYRTLTREDVAAHIAVKPTGPQRFQVSVRFPDARVVQFDVAGDEIYVDARVLKWKPLANYFGVHTAYELDRLAGRYRNIEQERSAPRTVHSLAVDKPVDLFGLRKRYVLLEPLVDAEYGSATFVPVNRATELELRVSTTGLLLRESTKPQ